MTRPRWRDEDGTAALEFTYLAVLLMVPLVYVLLTVFAVQRAAFAVTAAAREAGRAYASGTDAADARRRAASAGALVLSDHQLDSAGDEVRYPDGATFAPGDRVTIVVAVQVRLPFVGLVFRGDDGPSIAVSGRHVVTVDQYAGR